MNDKIEISVFPLRVVCLPCNAMQQRTYWCRRLANDSELVCWLWHCVAMAVALKRHERVNAFNLVVYAVQFLVSAAFKLLVVKLGA